MPDRMYNNGRTFSCIYINAHGLDDVGLWWGFSDDLGSIYFYCGFVILIFELVLGFCSTMVTVLFVVGQIVLTLNIKIGLAQVYH